MTSLLAVKHLTHNMARSEYANIAAERWTSLPAQFRRPGTSGHSQNQKRGRPLDSFLEGPVYVPTIALLFVTDIPYGRIFSINPVRAEWSLVIEYGGEPNGMAWNPISRTIVIADFKQGILSLVPKLENLKRSPLATTVNDSKDPMIWL